MKFVIARISKFCFILALFAGIGTSACASTPVALLDGKLTLEIEDGFVADKDRVTAKCLARFKARKGNAWGAVSRGIHGLEPAAITDYIGRKTAEYTKSLSWLPRLTWLKNETVYLHGQRWADLRFIGQREGAKGPMDGLLYTRILATSYEGQLLEILFTSNTDRESATKTKIDRMMDSIRLVD